MLTAVPDYVRVTVRWAGSCCACSRMAPSGIELAILLGMRIREATGADAAFDGRRGWVNRLATRSDQRGTGQGSAILAELERRLVDKGCRKINLLVERTTPPSPHSTTGTATPPTSSSSWSRRAHLHGEVARALTAG
jgi:GNAT superfamily N-acetyltransferase